MELLVCPVYACQVFQSSSTAEETLCQNLPRDSVFFCMGHTVIYIFLFMSR